MGGEERGEMREGQRGREGNNESTLCECMTENLK